jgi:CelD/BcsL family acetyltransferase involved in cellulose biosynthesis
MLTVDLIDDDRRFAGMAEEWDALLRESPARSIFLTWEWLYTWWRHLGQGRRLSILAVREGAALVGIAPFVLRRRWPRLSPLPTLEFLGTGDVGSDYLDLISTPGYEARVLGAVADHVAARRVSLRLLRVEASSALGARLAETLGGAGWSLGRSTAETCPCIALDGHTWDSYLASLGADHRYNVRRRLRNLERAGARFERVVSEEQLREVLPALVALHLMRWRERGGSEAFHREALVAFHEELSRRALARGWLRLFAWRLHGRVVAALYGFLYDGRFSFYQSGFDPREGQLSLGLAAMGLAIKSAIEEQAVAYDLLHGDEAYKFLWCREARRLVTLELFPPTAAGRIARQATATLRSVKRAARHTVPPRILEAAVAMRRLGRGRDLGAAAAR